MNERSHLVIAAVLSIAAVSVVGCETMLEIDPSSYEKLLVVHSVFGPDQDRWEVQVGHTASLNERIGPQDFAIDDATVNILHDGKVIAVLTHDRRGLYVGSGPPPEAGRSYTLRVSAPGFQTVTATSRVPNPVEVLEVSFSDSVGTISDWLGRHMLAAFDVRFADPKATDDFYQLNVMRNIGRVQHTGFYADHPALPRESLREIIRSDGIDRMTYIHAPFTDATFDGGAFESQFRFKRRPVHAYWVQLISLSEDYYRYAQSVTSREQTEENPFAEPVVLASNVKGGAGVFGGYLIQKTSPVVLAEITPERISGSYEASQFDMYVENGPSQNILREGGHLTLTLGADRTVSGRMLIPGSLSSTGDRVDVDLSGTFAIEEGRITFELDSTTFIEETAWYYANGSLLPFDPHNALGVNVWFRNRD